MESCSDSLFVQGCKVVCFGFCWRDVADRLEQAAVIKPVDPFEGGKFDGFQGFPRAFPPDDFGLVESIDGFRQSVVIAVTNTAHRRLKTCLGQTLRIPYTDILAATI